MKKDKKALTIIYPIIDEGNFEKISRQPSLRKSGKFTKYTQGSLEGNKKLIFKLLEENLKVEI